MVSLSNPCLNKIVTRFAPSPTGPLHLGHAYAAIVAHDLARAGGGDFLVRIEDLDAGRSRGAFEGAIFEDLAWLGLVPDAVPLRQSERMGEYAAALARLEAMGLLYPCFCTRREIAAEIARAGEAPQGPGATIYPGTCRALAAQESAARRAGGAPFALRLDVARAVEAALTCGPLRFWDAWVLGTEIEIIGTPKEHGDIVLARKDLGASYHLAVVVDDAASGVTLVTRGKDLLEATHVQVLLQRLLELPTPVYAHHPLVADESGKRLAKRDKALALGELRIRGWTADDVRRALPPFPDHRAALDAFTRRYSR